MSWGISLAKKIGFDALGRPSHKSSTQLDSNVCRAGKHNGQLIEPRCAQGAKWWISCENRSTARSQFVQNEAQNQR